MSDRAAHPGYRLHALEVYNWGTFDGPHAVPLDGHTALLVGQNGAGKSTLVDALLVLLVRSGGRNFNLAAGAGKKERSELSYVRGAHGRASRGDAGTAVSYLRTGQTFSAVLACFRNGSRAVTLAVLLYPTADGIDKWYCLAHDERTLHDLLDGLRSADRLKRQLTDRGFKATDKYADYHEWFAKEFGLRPKAMDVFSQTVAVKDIHSLTHFVRDYMLEPKAWGEKVEELLNHFAELSQTHAELVQIRRQAELLEPIAAAGGTYRAREAAAARARARARALDPFFRRKTVELFEPACETKRREREVVRARKEAIERDVSDNHDRRRELQNAIEHSADKRLPVIAERIRTCEAEARAKRAADLNYRGALQGAGVSDPVTDAETFAAVRARLVGLLHNFDGDVSRQTEEGRRLIVERERIAVPLREDEEERKSLALRRNNIPDSVAQVRRGLCAAIGVKEAELPFVAELVAVEERSWEPTAEMLLRSYALNLLVPERHYPAVAEYVEGTRLADAHGRGQRLAYVPVGAGTAGEPNPHPRALVRKLRFRPGHPLVPWVRAALAAKFDVRCCETIDEFRAAPPPAATQQRHVKWPNRHEKDDRPVALDATRFVLGWDNGEKLARLDEAIRGRREQLGALDRRAAAAEQAVTALRARQEAIRTALSIADFGAIDFATHERDADALRREKQKLEEGSDTLRALRAQLAEAEGRGAALAADRDAARDRERDLDREIRQGEVMVANATGLLRRWAADGTLDQCAASLAELEELTRDDPLTADALLEREPVFKAAVRGEAEGLDAGLKPLAADLLKLMGKFLKESPAAKTDLDAGIDYLDEFVRRWEAIRRDGLPEHERRFKERLNEKVTREIGLLRARLQTDQNEIAARIDQLNTSLRQLEYAPGTHMQLAAQPTRDADVQAFRGALADCLAGMLDDADATDEARYARIEKLAARLRDEPEWRARVIDVRRWFDFAAREFDTAGGKELRCYTDGAGQSGGEKAKLAFTVLAAAIADQYDIDPARPADRFRFVVIDEMFSKVDDRHAEYALRLFARFGLQLLIVAPLDAKACVADPYADRYLLVVKGADTNCSAVHAVAAGEVGRDAPPAPAPRPPARPVLKPR